MGFSGVAENHHRCFANEADEVRLALDWQGFVVDLGEVDALVHEVGQRSGLNQPGA